MDFTKFVSLLDKQALFFARADKLRDPFEGAYSKANASLRPVIYEKEIHEALSKQLTDFAKKTRQFTLVSCWHEGRYESEAMWKLYSREFDGIAIRTCFQSLASSFTCSESIYIGRVNYVDYDTAFIPESNSFYPYLHKRPSFKHENEVRAITQNFPIVDQRADLSQPIFEVGTYYSVDVASLIQKVIVAPYADAWFIELVRSVANRYGLKVPVIKSVLAETPTWS